LPELRAECESKREVSETGEEVEEGAVGRDASAARLQRHPPSSLLPPSSQLNAARLASAVASHVDAARSGAALLDGAGRAVARLRECYAVGEEERGGWWREGGGRRQADDPFPPSVSSPPQTIDRLCAESGALVHRPDTIAALARAASRARDAVAGARAVADLPAAAAAAEAALEGGASLAAVHEAVAVLEGTAAAARRALDGAEGAAAGAPPPPPPRRRGAPPPAPPPAPLTPYFARVEAAGRALEDRLWATVRALPALASPGGDARALAGAARALAVQDAVDAHLDAAAAAGATAATPTPAPKRWWARATRHVAASFADAFAPALAAASRLSTAPDTDAGVRALLDACQAAVGAVVAVADGAAPTFARGGELVAAAAAAAHSNIAHAIAAAAAAAPALANADILRVVAWCDAYSATLDGLGAGAALADGPALALAPLHAAYRARCKASLGEREGRGRGRGRGRDQAPTSPPVCLPPSPAGWCRNILASDLAAAPRQRPDGRLYTPGGADFFRAAHDQLAAAAAATDGDLVLGVATDVVGVMQEYQLALAAVVAGAGGGGAAARGAGGAPPTPPPSVPPPAPLPLLDDAQLTALANNAAASYRESAEFADRVDASLTPALRHRLDVDAAARGFADLAAGAARALAARVFGDAGLGELAARVCAGPDWRDGSVTASLVATLGDYLEDYRALAEKALFVRVAERVLATAAATVGAVALTLSKTPSSADAARLRTDAADLEAAFTAWGARPAAVAAAVRPLVDIAALIDGPDADSLRLAATSLLTAAPTIPSSMLERLLAARGDLTRAERGEAAAAARDAAAARRAAAVAPRARSDGPVATLLGKAAGVPTAGPVSRDAACRAAFLALRDAAAPAAGDGA